MANWSGFQQQQRQWQQRQRDMQGAWWQQQKRREERERADAERRAREEAARRAQAHQRDTRVSDEPSGWRPPGEGQAGPEAAGGGAVGHLSQSRGFFRELPRRVARLVLFGVVVLSFVVAASALSSGDGDTEFVAALIGFVALLLAGALEPGRRGSFEGVATHVIPLPGSGATPSRLTFRLERYDSRGGRMTPIPVEMKGGDMKGQLLDGDEVRTVGGRIRGGALHPRRVVNLRTGETVRLGRRVGYWIGLSITWAIFGAFMLALVWIATS